MNWQKKQIGQNQYLLDTQQKLKTGFFYFKKQTFYYDYQTGQKKFGRQNVDGISYDLNSSSGALQRSSDPFSEKVIAWFNHRRHSLTYSLDGARNGADGTADCSGAITQAIYAAGAPKYVEVYDTQTLHPYLKQAGYHLIAENKTIYVRRGDLVLLGRYQHGKRPAGVFGHIGVITSGGWLLDPTAQALILSVSGRNKAADGSHAKNQAVIEMPFYDQWHQVYFYVYRYYKK
jgi:hypothetical protein